MELEFNMIPYDEMPEFTECVEGAEIIDTTGDEIGVAYVPNVEYANIDGNSLKLQLLLPFTRNEPFMKCPCILFVQGSAWFPQDCYRQVPNLAKLAGRGYVVGIVEYRHSFIATFPSQIMDARNAIRFMKVHADEYHVDVNNIFISGDSSGGHTAMFAGMLHDDRESVFEGVNADVNGIINFYGSTSVMNDNSNPSTPNHCKADSPEGFVMGKVDLDRAMQEQLSVECNINEDTVIPPVIIFHGTKDRIVNCEGSVILYNRLKECGKEAKLYLVKGGDHGGAEFFTDKVLDIVDAFVKKNLK